MKRPEILKEGVEITRNNLVGDEYIIANEDLTDDPIWTAINDFELDRYIAKKLNLKSVRVSTVPREYLRQHIGKSLREDGE